MAEVSVHTTKYNIVSFKEMPPGSYGIIVGARDKDAGSYQGMIVLKPLCEDADFVINLHDGDHWHNIEDVTFQVKLLLPGDKIEIRI